TNASAAAGTSVNDAPRAASDSTIATTSAAIRFIREPRFPVFEVAILPARTRSGQGEKRAVASPELHICRFDDNGLIYLCKLRPEQREDPLPVPLRGRAVVMRRAVGGEAVLDTGVVLHLVARARGRERRAQALGLARLQPRVDAGHGDVDGAADLA